MVLKTLLIAFVFYASSAFSSTLNVIAYPAPPYLVKEKNKMQGVTAKLIEAAVNEAGMETYFVSFSFDLALKACHSNPDCVLVGSFEGIGTDFDTPLYQVNFVKYSTTFFYDHELHPEYAEFSEPGDFAGKKIALLESEFQNLGEFEKAGAETIRLPNHTSIMQILDGNRVDFSHFVNLIGFYEAAKFPQKDIRRVKTSLVSSQGGLVFKNRDTAEKMYEAFKRLHSRGVLKEIAREQLQPYNDDISAQEFIPAEITLETRTFD